MDALNIPSQRKVKAVIHGQDCIDEDKDEFDEDFDVDVSLDIEASPDDVEAMLAADCTDFEAVSKLMAFVMQMRKCGEDTTEYFKKECATQGCKPLKLKLWVQTHWGSLYNCFDRVLLVRKVSRTNFCWFCIPTDIT